MQSFSEIAKKAEIDRDGSKLHIADVLGKEIIVTGFDMRPSNMHKKAYLCLKFVMNDEKHVLFTDSAVLERQCRKFEEKMPFTATIVQKQRYYTFA